MPYIYNFNKFYKLLTFCKDIKTPVKFFIYVFDIAVWCSTNHCTIYYILYYIYYIYRVCVDNVSSPLLTYKIRLQCLNGKQRRQICTGLNFQIIHRWSRVFRIFWKLWTTEKSQTTSLPDFSIILYIIYIIYMGCGF